MAILSASYTYDGEFDTGAIIANRLRDATPRDKYYDLDQLFRGYGLIMVDTQRSVELLNDVVVRNPTWLLCHAMLADAWLHLAYLENSDTNIEAAFQKSNALLALMGDTPFALDVSLFAHKASVEFLQAKQRDYTHLVASGENVIERLSRYPDFILAHAMPGQFYDVLGEEERAEQASAQVLQRGGKLWRWIALGRLYWSKPSSELLDTIENVRTRDDDLWVSAAKACVLADMPDGKQEAMRIFNHIRAQQTTLMDQYFAIHIPLLLGEKQLAIQVAGQWVSEWEAAMPTEGNTTSIYSEGNNPLRTIVADGEWMPTKRNRVTDVTISHVRGLLAIADGDRELAKSSFLASTCKPWVGLDVYWGEAFRRHLQEDDAWPRENARMRTR